MENPRLLYKYADKNNREKESVIIDGDKDSEYICKGGYGNVSKKYFKLKKNDKFKDISLVEKKPENSDFNKYEIERQLRIHSILKKAGVNTFTTFRSDGKSFYSTPLNGDEIIAVSSNNDSPFYKLINEDEPTNATRKKFTEIIKIKNFEGVLQKIIDISVKIPPTGLSLYKDCLLYVFNPNENSVTLDILIGDFDKMLINKPFDTSTRDCLEILKSSLIIFINKYVDKVEADQYKEMLEKRINFNLKNGEVLTKNGKKNIIDYKLNDEIILYAETIKIDYSFSTQNVMNVAGIDGIAVDFTNCPQHIKDEIVEVKGDLIDNVSEFIYPKLRNVNGDLKASFAYKFMADDLCAVGKNLIADKVIVFKCDNLSNIGGCLDISYGFTRLFEANKLETVEEGVLAPGVTVFNAKHLQNAKYISLSSVLEDIDIPDIDLEVRYYDFDINRDIIFSNTSNFKDYFKKHSK